MSEGFILTSGPLDLTGHADNCELHGTARTMCSADAMNPNRQIVFSCTCGKFVKGLKVRVPWWKRLRVRRGEVKGGV